MWPLVPFFTQYKVFKIHSRHSLYLYFIAEQYSCMDYISFCLFMLNH